jgi:hypothetical protein
MEGLAGPVETPGLTAPGERNPMLTQSYAALVLAHQIVTRLAAQLSGMTAEEAAADGQKFPGRESGFGGVASFTE